MPLATLYAMHMPSTPQRDRADEHRQFRPVAGARHSRRIGSGPPQFPARAGLERCRKTRFRPRRLRRAADPAGQIPARFHHGRTGRGDLARCRGGPARRSEAAPLDVPAARQGRDRRAPELGVAAVFGDGALPALGLPDEPGAVRRWEDGVVLVDPRLRRARGARHPGPRASCPPCRIRLRREPISPPTTATASRSAFPTAAAIWCRKNRSCSNRGSTS